MKQASRDADLTRTLRRYFAVISPAARARAPYDYVYHAPAGPIYLKRKTPIGASVTLGDRQVRRLAAFGEGALWINGAAILLTSLRGVAHRHVHALDSGVKTIVFRVVAGRPLPPRSCLGKCEGPLP